MTRTTISLSKVSMIKSHLGYAMMILLGTAAIIALITLAGYIGYVGHAHAQGIGSGSGSAIIPPPDPTPSSDAGSAFLAFITAGQWLPAVGVLLTIASGAIRAGLAKLSAWFSTTLGGYAVAWSSTTVLYLGTALEAGPVASWKSLIAVALAAGLVASGLLTHYQAITTGLAAMRQRAKTTLTTIVVSALIVGSSMSCKTVGPAGQCEISAVEQVVTTQGGTDISIVASIVSAVMTGGATLPALIAQLETAFGPQTVACAEELADDIASAIQGLLAPTPAVATSAAPSQIQLGLTALHADMDKRHLHHR